MIHSYEKYQNCRDDHSDIEIQVDSNHENDKEIISIADEFSQLLNSIVFCL